MGIQASNQHSSMIRLSFRSLVLVFTLHAALVGCRGPWFKRTENFDPIVVSEKSEPRTPREFASSRLRPSNSAGLSSAESLANAPRPETNSRTISDAVDESGSDEGIVEDDSISAEHRALYQRQLLAIKNKAAGDLLEINDNEPVLSPQNTDSASTFSISDDDESASPENGQSAKSPAVKSPAVKSEEALREQSSSKAATRDAQGQIAQTNPNAGPKAGPQANQQRRFEADRQKSGDTEKGRVIQVSDNAPVDAGRVGRNSIAIETPASDWRTLAHEARAAMQSEAESAAAQSPSQQLAIEAKMRMLSLVLDDLEGAMTPIEFLEPDAKDYFAHQFQAFHAAIDPQGNPVINRRWTIALQSQRKAQSHLAAVSNLEVQNVAFCTEVDSFGIISKFPQYHFKRDQELLLYCELDNFVSEKLKNEYETKLQGSYEIVDSSGRRVADQMLPPDEHICSNQRRDYFIAYRMYMPQEIKPGRYTLKLTIEDMKGHKFGQSSVEFQIVQ